MPHYRIGDLIVENTQPGGITRGPWMITMIAESTLGNVYTIRLTSNNTQIDTINQYEIDNCFHRRNPRGQ